ncbi:MAG TPA: DUF192 domain-containing protein [Steroidobacteraceae bacterium]|nr:DUF192 domain-containing protein [Steroidobacteraceae bacterium]
MRAVFACVALALSVACTADEPVYEVPPHLAGLPMSAVTVETASGTHRFRVWIAADPVSRANGLMLVREMPADHGMLFLLERAQYTTFWMRDTVLPLDLVFIGADGRVVNIAYQTRPFSEDPIPSAAPVIAVLEVLAGTAARIGLAVGDRIEMPIRPTA